MFPDWVFVANVVIGVVIAGFALNLSEFLSEEVLKCQKK